MKPAEERFYEAMQELSAQSPSSAPPQLGVKLHAAFRRHHLRRRRQRRLAWAAALAMVIVTMFVTREKLSIHRQPAPTLTAQVTPTPAQSPQQKTMGDSSAAQPRAMAKANRPRRKPAMTSVARDFVPLPGYDPALSTNEFKIVRLGLASAELYQLGLPARASTRRALTDVVIDGDGIPVAVRLASR